MLTFGEGDLPKCKANAKVEAQSVMLTSNLALDLQVTYNCLLALFLCLQISDRISYFPRQVYSTILASRIYLPDIQEIKFPIESGAKKVHKVEQEVGLFLFRKYYFTRYFTMFFTIYFSEKYLPNTATTQVLI